MRRSFLKTVLGVLILVGPTQSSAAEPPPLEAYGELPGVEQMAMSPSGSRIATLTTIKGKRMLLALDSDMNLLRMYEAGDTKVRDISWVGEDAVLIVVSQTQQLPQGYVAKQSEAWSAVIMPLDTSQDVKVVFGNQLGVLERIFDNYGQRLIDGKWHTYFTGLDRLAIGGIKLFDVDSANGKGTVIAEPPNSGGAGNIDWLIAPDGKIAATFTQNHRTGRWEIRNSSYKLLASGKDPEGDAGLISLGRNGDTLIYAAQDPDDSLMDWYEMPLDGSVPAVEVYRDKTIAGPLKDRESGLMIGYMEGLGEPAPFLFDPAKQRAVDAVRRTFRGQQVTFSDWTADFSRVLVHTDGNRNSGTWYLVDLENKRAQDIGGDYPQIRPDMVGQISTIVFTASDGLEMDGILTLPPGREAKNLPVVIFPHGGPSSQDDPKFDWWAQAFASRGYAVFQPNFRGSTNRDPSFRRAGYGQWGRKMQSDISDGLAELVKQGIVDPKRACIMGASYGGFAALAGVTLQQGLYRCAVAVAGVSDLELMFREDFQQSGTNPMLKRSYIEELGPRSGFKDVSPRRFASQADAPILLIHGKHDTVVNFEQSEKMAEELKRAAKPYEMVVLDKEDHWLSRSETRKQMLAAAMAFVQKYNPAD